MRSEKQNYWTDTEFRNSSPDAKRLYSKTNKFTIWGIILLFVLNAIRNFISNVPILVMLVAVGYIVSIVLCVKAIIYGFRLKKLYSEYKK